MNVVWCCVFPGCLYLLHVNLCVFHLIIKSLCCVQYNVYSSITSSFCSYTCSDVPALHPLFNEYLNIDICCFKIVTVIIYRMFPLSLTRYRQLFHRSQVSSRLIPEWIRAGRRHVTCSSESDTECTLQRARQEIWRTAARLVKWRSITPPPVWELSVCSGRQHHRIRSNCLFWTRGVWNKARLMVNEVCLPWSQSSPCHEGGLLYTLAASPWQLWKSTEFHSRHLDFQPELSALLK